MGTLYKFPSGVPADDLLWAEPGTRILTDAELATIIPPRPVYPPPDVGAVWRGDLALMLVAFGFTLGLAFYGAVKLGGEVVHMILGVQ